METALPWIGAASTAMFVGLAAVCFAQYRRLRDAGTGWLAASFGVLAAVSVIGRVTEGRTYTDWLNDVSLLGFAASGYTLLRFREVLQPLSSRTRLLAKVALFGSATFAIAADLPPTGEPIEGAGTIAILLLIGAWNGAVLDPTIRFWRAARGRPAVLAARLRALAMGYGGIVVVLFVAGGAASAGSTSVTTRFWTSVSALFILPFLAVAVLPPRWLRRIWRSREEDAVRSSLVDLLQSSHDRVEVANLAIENALRLSGATYGRIVLDGEVIAERGGPNRGGGRNLAVPFRESTREGALEITAGPLMPYFGRDEATRLEQYVVPVAMALERVSLLEALQSQTETYASLLDALSALEQGIVVERGPVVEYANDAYRRLIGFVDEELSAVPGLHPLIGLPSSMPPQAERVGRRAAITRLDGGEIQIEYSARVIQAGDARTMAVVRDVTEQYLVERENSLLRTTAVGVASAETLEESMRSVLASVAATGRWRFAEAWMPQGADLALIATWRHGNVPAAEEGATYIGTGGLFATALSQRRVEWVVDVNEDAGFLRMDPALRGSLGAACLVPVVDAGEPIAVLAFYLPRPSARDERVCEVLRSVASQLAVAIKRRRADAAMATYAAELERRNRELQEFSYAASHDLQEPLRMVTSFVRLLGDRYTERLDGDALEFIAFAVEGAERMRALIYDLLELTRVDTRGEPPVELELDACVEDAAKDLAVAIAESNATIKVGPLPSVIVDRSQITRVFENLIANAIKFRGEADPVITVSSEREAGAVIVSVRDNGIGIDPAHAERIFGLFTRLGKREEHEGSGVGLAISKRIIERHGGRLWVEPAPDGGSIFRFTLPTQGGVQSWSIPA